MHKKTYDNKEILSYPFVDSAIQSAVGDGASCMLLVILHHDAFCSNTSNYGISLFRFTGTIESQDSSSREAENFDRNKDKSNYPGLDQQEQAPERRAGVETT